MGNRKFGWHSGTLKCQYINLRNSYSSSQIHGMRIEFTKTSIGGGSPRALTLWAVLKAPSGYAGSGVNACHANVYVGGGNTGVTGEGHAMASQLIIESEARSMQGTWCAHKFVNEFGASNVMPSTTTFFLRFHDAGNVKTPLMFDFSGCAADAANCIEEESGMPATNYGYLRVKCPDSTIGLIPIAATHA